jgi:hypothetical protein
MRVSKNLLNRKDARRKRNERKENFCETSVFLTTKGHKGGTKGHKISFFIKLLIIYSLCFLCAFSVVLCG